MLKDNTIKVLNKKAEEEVEIKTSFYKNVEIVNIPIVITRDEERRVSSITSFDNKIIDLEN